MPAAKRTTDREKLLGALGDSFKAMREAARTEQKRGIRFSKRLLNEIEQGQRELTQLGRRISSSPGDVGEMYEAGVDLARRGTSHSSALAQELVSGAQKAGKDVRTSARKVVSANQAVVKALGDAVMGAAGSIARRRPAAKPAARRAPAKRRTTAAKRTTTAKRRPATARRRTTTAARKRTAVASASARTAD
jgi:hypothetical protein